MSTLTLPSGPTGRRQDAKVMGLIGLAHAISHFSQLLLAPLFPWLKVEFGVSYAELGFLLTIFFVVSCAVQAMSGFWVDRYGPRPVLFGGLVLVGAAAVGYASSTSYAMLAVFSVLAGIGNGVFHPVDYTVLNRKIAKERLGHAYSVHGITGSLGWALAPLLLVPLTLAYSWRVALLCAAGLVFVVLAVLWLQREQIRVPAAAAPLPGAHSGSAGPAEGSFAFLKIPAVWMCFAFFFFFAGALSIVQSFGPQAAKELHGVPAHLAAICLTVYMVCSAVGMLMGGFLAADPERCDRVVGSALAVAACIALVLAFASVPGWGVPVLFGAMGLAAGVASPSRDMLVKRATPANATGRVYGVVYGGLDVGQAVVPLFIGMLMDQGAYRGVLLALAALQVTLIVSAFRVNAVRREAGATAAA